MSPTLPRQPRAFARNCSNCPSGPPTRLSLVTRPPASPSRSGGGKFKFSCTVTSGTYHTHSFFPMALLVCTAEGSILWDVQAQTVISAYKDGGVPGLRCVVSVCAEVCRGQPAWPSSFALAQSGVASVSQFSWGCDTPLYRCAVSEPLSALAASRDGTLLAGGGASGRLYLWDTSTGELAKEWQGHYKATSCLAFSPCGALLASGGLDGVAHCWDVCSLLDVSSSSGGGAPPSASATWSGHSMALTHLAFSPLSGLAGGPAGSRLVTASLDRTVRWWDVATQRCLRTAALPVGATCLCPDGTGSTWYVGGLDGGIYVLSGAAGSGSGGGGPSGAPGVLAGHTAAVTCLAVTVDGDRVVSGGDDGTVRVWNAASRAQIGTIGGVSAAAAAAHSSSHKRTSIAALVLLPTRPPALQQQHRAGLASSGAAGGGGAVHAPLPLPPVAPLRKHLAFSAAGAGAVGGDGRLAVMRIRASGDLHKDSKATTGALREALHILQSIQGSGGAGSGEPAVPSAQQPPASLEGGSGDAGGGAAAAETEATLRERVAALEAENARWKAVAGKLLGKSA